MFLVHLKNVPFWIEKSIYKNFQKVPFTVYRNLNRKCGKSIKNFRFFFLYLTLIKNKIVSFQELAYLLIVVELIVGTKKTFELLLQIGIFKQE